MPPRAWTSSPAPDTAARLALLIRESDFGLSLDDLVARTGLARRTRSRAPRLKALPGREWYVDAAWYQSTRDRLVRAVREFHAAQSAAARHSQAGPPRARAPGRAALPPRRACSPTRRTWWSKAKRSAAASHKVTLKEDEEQARGAIERAFEDAGLSVPSVAEVLAKSGVEPARARTLLALLLREKRLARISDDLVFHRSAIDNLRDLLAARKSQRFNVTAFKEWTGISRKYAIPLLEFLDREHVTRREGDERLVL